MIVRKVTVPSGTAVMIAKTGFGDPIILTNLGSGSLYIGQDNTVTNADGFPVTINPAVNSVLNLLSYEGEVWGYALSADCDVRVIESISG